MSLWFPCGLLNLLSQLLYLLLCLADFKPSQRELVIDIDISDYDELRTCGSGGHICSRCWPFMAVAIQVCSINERLQTSRRNAWHLSLDCKCRAHM